MRITISGDGGSGKGTLSRLLCQKYNLKSYDVGGMRRAEAKSRDMTIGEFNTWCEENPDKGGDTVFDEKQKLIGETEDDFVMVGRLPWHFIPHSLKILLKVTPAQAGLRIFKHIQKQGRVGEKYDTVEDTINFVRKRNSSDCARYMDLYGLDYTDESNYDLVIDSTNLSPDEVFEKIVEVIKARKW